MSLLTKVLAIMGLIAFQTILFVGFYANKSTPPSEYNPLGSYPIQVVENRVPGIPGPSVYLGDPVIVSAVKCNDSKDPVSVVGSSTWQTVMPPGSNVSKNGGVNSPAIRQPGCSTFKFNNAMPQGVIDRTQELFDQGYSSVVWRIVGQETPVDHPNGVVKVWTTEDFIVVKK